MNIDTISATVATLLIEAKKRGVEVKECGSGHFQIKGGRILVNYYPDSRRRSAYVAGTTKRYEYVSPEKAISMAFEPPPVAHHGRKDGRKGNYRKERTKLLAKDNHCYWCRCELTIDTSTMDHVIPLYRGGLDNANNRVLACEPCNHKRGHSMPELKGNHDRK